MQGVPTVPMHVNSALPNAPCDHSSEDSLRNLRVPGALSTTFPSIATRPIVFAAEALTDLPLDAAQPNSPLKAGQNCDLDLVIVMSAGAAPRNETFQ